MMVRGVMDRLVNGRSHRRPRSRWAATGSASVSRGRAASDS